MIKNMIISILLLIIFTLVTKWQVSASMIVVFTTLTIGVWILISVGERDYWRWRNK